eukprot:6805221-Ditylum_brightwellii.AAC.1
MDLSIKIGNSHSPQRLKRKEPYNSIPQLGLKNNPAADYSKSSKVRRVSIHASVLGTRPAGSETPAGTSQGRNNNRKPNYDCAKLYTTGG